MKVRFSGPPPVDAIRTAIGKRVAGEVTVQNFESASNEVAIGTELKDERQSDQNRRAILETLESTFAKGGDGKLDFNNTGQEALAARLRDPLTRNGVQLSDTQLDQLVADLLKFKNTPPRSGLITNFDQLAGVPGVNPAVINTLKQECSLAPFSVREVEIVGPKVGADLRRQAISGHACRAGRNAGIYSVSL